MSGETKRPTTSLQNFLEIRLDRNKKVKNENKSSIFLSNKITLHEQNMKNGEIKFKNIAPNYEKLLNKSLKHSY